MAGDPEASETLSSIALPRLRGFLRAAFRLTNPDLINDAAEDAILEYLQDPGRFNPSMAVSLDRFLYVIAKRRLANRVRGERRRLARAANYLRSALHALTLRPIEEAMSGPQSPLTRHLLSACRPNERQALVLWLQGAADGDLVRALNIASVTPADRTQELKRFKDRMRQRARRERAKRMQ
jgi:DNA-directed RNA polymerase specialized sigma24 family protein